MADNLFLCYFGDGPYWTDTTYLPALPSGVSYVHEFRYESSLVSSALKRNNLNEITKKGGLVGRKVCLGARFATDGRLTKVLPIREAEITHVSVSGTLYQFYFVLGPLYPFDASKTLASHLVEVGKVPADHEHGALAFENKTTLPTPAVENDHSQYQAWEAFADLVGQDANKYFDVKARKSVFLRVQSPRIASNGKFAQPKCIRKSSTSAPIYGFKILEHTEYELPVYYRIPSLISANETPGDFTITPTVSSDQIALGSTSLHVVGNYGSKNLGITALGSTSTVELSLAPPETISGQSGSDLYSTTLVTSIRGGFNLWQALKRRWFPNLALFLALLMLGVISLGEKIISPYLQGQITNEDITSRWQLGLVWVLASAIATLAVQALRGKT